MAFSIKQNTSHFLLSFRRLVFQKAVEVMCVVPKRCNDMMNVGRLQGFDVRSHLYFLSVSQPHQEHLRVSSPVPAHLWTFYLFCIFRVKS